MAHEIRIPRLGWNMDEGDFVEWLRRDGEMIEAGQPLFSLETDKAVTEVEALDSGILRIAGNGPRQGQTLAVGTIIGHLCADGEEPPAAEASQDTTACVKATEQAEAQSVGRQPEPRRIAGAPQRGRTISPRAARLAAELGVDWTKVQGSGRTGRVRECDIHDAADARD